MKLLHISHHVGCMRDHAYVYNKLNIDYEFWRFPKDVYNISKQLANEVWNKRKDYFNTFDYIVTSDTAPLSRIFMENIHEVKPSIVVWICNRFDYNMENDSAFYQLFSKISNENQNKFKIVPYSDFEIIWCNIKGLTNLLPVVTPIGINLVELEPNIDNLNEFKQFYIHDSNAKEFYSDKNDLIDKVFIPIYSNDNHYFKLKNILDENNIKCFNGGYTHSSDLKNCKCMVTFPEQFSKFITFETIQNEIIVLLPSDKYLISLHPTSNNNRNYWFNNPLGYLDKNTIQLCEWYRYKNCRIYFDSIEDLINKIKSLTPEIIQEKRKWCKIYGKEIEATNIKAWKEILN